MNYLSSQLVQQSPSIHFQNGGGNIQPLGRMMFQQSPSIQFIQPNQQGIHNGFGSQLMRSSLSGFPKTGICMDPSNGLIRAPAKSDSTGFHDQSNFQQSQQPHMSTQSSFNQKNVQNSIIPPSKLQRQSSFHLQNSRLSLQSVPSSISLNPNSLSKNQTIGINGNTSPQSQPRTNNQLSSPLQRIISPNSRCIYASPQAPTLGQHSRQQERITCSVQQQQQLQYSSTTSRTSNMVCNLSRPQSPGIQNIPISSSSLSDYCSQQSYFTGNQHFKQVGPSSSQGGFAYSQGSAYTPLTQPSLSLRHEITPKSNASKIKKIIIDKPAIINVPAKKKETDISGKKPDNILVDEISPMKNIKLSHSEYQGSKKMNIADFQATPSAVRAFSKSEQKQHQTNLNVKLIEGETMNDKIAPKSMNPHSETEADEDSEISMSTLNENKKRFKQLQEEFKAVQVKLASRMDKNSISESNSPSVAKENKSSKPNEIKKEFQSTAGLHKDILQQQQKGMLNRKFQKVTLKNEDQYIGSIENDLPCGYGVLKNRNGQEIFKGDWLKGCYHGSGILVNKLINQQQSASKQETKEEWVESMKNLSRIVATNSWIKYEGEFQDHLIHGFGSLYLQNNRKIVGNFDKGVPNGHCSLYSADGKVTAALYQNGILQQILWN